MPPVGELGMATLAIVIVGGIFMAAHVPRTAPLVFPAVMLAVAAVLLVVNLVIMSRIKPFAWDVFLRVAGWALLAYLVIAGMLIYVFTYDHTRGSELWLLIGMLVIFAVDVPLMIGFTVARYQDVDEAGAQPAPVAA